MGYLGLVVVAGFVIWSLLSERKRKKQIRNYAQSAGLTYIGAALPKSFPLSQTSVSRASSIKNVVAGDKNGKELLIFDCQLGTGKGRRMLTVAAVRGSVESFGVARFGPDLITETVDGWTLIHRPHRFLSFSGILPLEEIEALFSAIQRATLRRPRHSGPWVGAPVASLRCLLPGLHSVVQPCRAY